VILRPRSLRKGDKVTLRPSNEQTTVRATYKSLFSVSGHMMLAFLYADEYDPETNPSGTWQRTPKGEE
jgi:hypothetical protein